MGNCRPCILSVSYIVHGMDFEEVGWPRNSSVLPVDSGGREEVCWPSLCTQVSYQAQGQGRITRHLVCEDQQRLVAVEIYAKTMGRQMA